ncbi:MAG: hypothetical protein EXS10_09760 [Phycisphaerales bacterium]|nr:hypothetical protein [Phycisphaerales bacterium]
MIVAHAVVAGCDQQCGASKDAISTVAALEEPRSARVPTDEEARSGKFCPVGQISVDAAANVQTIARSATEVDARVRSHQIVSQPRFDNFRTLALPYLSTIRSMLPIDRKFGSSDITDEERARYWQLDATKNEQWRDVWKCIYDKRWSIDDRGAMMQWLLFENDSER